MDRPSNGVATFLHPHPIPPTIPMHKYQNLALACPVFLHLPRKPRNALGHLETLKRVFVAIQYDSDVLDRFNYGRTDYLPRSYRWS